MRGISRRLYTDWRLSSARLKTAFLMNAVIRRPLAIFPATRLETLPLGSGRDRLPWARKVACLRVVDLSLDQTDHVTGERAQMQVKRR